MLLELIQSSPKTSIVVISLLISFFISVVNYFVIDKERMREIKARQKEIQTEMKEHQKAGNHEEMAILQKEMMSNIGASFKQSFKPMLITLIPILVLFAFIRNTYAATTIAKTWFWWYLGAAIISSMLFRKLFNLP